MNKLKIKKTENDLYYRMLHEGDIRETNLPRGFTMKVNYQEKDYLPLVKTKIGWQPDRSNRTAPLEKFGLTQNPLINKDRISKNKKCPHCRGKGNLYYEPCDFCGGTGEIFYAEGRKTK